MITRFSAILVGVFFCISPVFCQSLVTLESQPGPIIVCPHGSFDGIHNIQAPREVLDRMRMKDVGSPCATFEVTYINFPANAEAAFQEAVDIWSYSLSSDVTIRVEATWTNLGSNVLGSAGPTFVYSNFANAPDDSYYAGALADKIAGTDLDPGSPDIEASFNSNFTWYYGIDGNCPYNKYDLVSVVLHELGHGLGFVSSASYSAGSGSIGVDLFNTPLGYDEFMLLGQNGTEILSLSQGTVLGSAFVSNNVYCGSDAATAVNGNVQPKLYAPATYSDGSSISHWDESTYPATNINALMTPQIGPGQSIHNPGPITMGLFEDMGWSLCIADCPLLELSIGSPCDDGNPDTENDVVTSDCQCAGTPMDGTIDGSISWNSACGSRAIQVKFYDPETETLIFEMNDSMDSEGHFSFTGIAPGIYDIIVKADGYLAKLIPDFSVTNGTNNLVAGSLIPGDFSGDNYINIIDISLLSPAFGSSIGDPNYNSLIDINCDGVVNVLDISSISSSFGMQGNHLGL